MPLAADLTEHGVAAWNIEYRRVGGDGGWPNTCLDVAAAVDALGETVQEVAGGRLDLSRVVGLGHSSGGHLVAWLAGRHRLPESAPGGRPAVRIIGAVSQSGVLDLADASAQGLVSGAIDDFMGMDSVAGAEHYALCSPIALLPTGVPVVCVHGEDDPTVPIGQSERYVAAALAAGDPARFIALPGIGHFPVIDPSHPAWRVCREAVLEIARS
jgi:acetyl esterase/lipase